METAMQTQTEQAGMPATQHDISTTAMSLNFDPRMFDLAERFGRQMSAGNCTVPKHLKGNEADCSAIAMQALRWGMDPFAVAQKTHLVNGNLGYEAQLINAVICSSKAIQGRFHYEYGGNWAKPNDPSAFVRVGAIIRGEEEITWGEPVYPAQVTVKNSPLWKTDPKQQSAYLAVKRWSRMYTPHVILGVYTVDEWEDSPRKERELNPMQKAPAATKSKALNKAMDDAGEISSNAVALIKKCEGAATMAALKTVYAEIATAAQAGKLTVSDRTELNKVYTTCKAELEAIEADEQAQAGGDE